MLSLEEFFRILLFYLGLVSTFIHGLSSFIAYGRSALSG